MHDTRPDIAAKYREMIMRKSGEERLLMGCSMYETTRKIVHSAIGHQYPGISKTEMNREIFLRFYGMEFNPADREKTLSALTS